MRTEGNPPAWAVKLVERVCEDYGRSLPSLAWRRSSKHHGTSGHYGNRRIVITAGSDPWDQKHTLLHELAHHLKPGTNHSTEFYKTAFDLYRRFDGNIARHKRREYAYHPRTAKSGYLKSRAALSGGR